MVIRVLKNDQDIYILGLYGSLDLYSSNQLKDLVMKILERRVEKLILDLKKMDSINSSGMGALINVSSTFKKLNIPMAITNMNSAVQKAMDITKLSGYLPLSPTLKAAMAR